MTRRLNSANSESIQFLLHTLYRFDIINKYDITVEYRPGTSLNKYSNIVYDQPERMYSMVVRIISKDNNETKVRFWLYET